MAKTILITGASKGIGASFSNFLASEGYRIIGIARNKDQLIKTFNSLPNQNLNHDIVPIDITDFNLVKEKLSHVNLYCLINNAGIALSNLLHEMTKSQSIELAKYNILVNAICPGYIITDLNRSFLESEKSSKLKSKIPLDRFASCDELLPSLKMLVDPNNSYMTGSIITIDGGMNSTL